MAEENIYRKFVQFDGSKLEQVASQCIVTRKESNRIEEDLDKILDRTIDDENELKCLKEEKKCKAILVQCIAVTNLEYDSYVRFVKGSFR